MSRVAYIKYLEETASLVGPFLEKVYRPYREQHESLYKELMLFAGSRLRRPLQKPALFRLSYEVCGGKEWERFVHVAAAFELLNISSYQANASFDKKLGTLTEEKKDAQFICSMISRELATKVLRECPALAAESLAGLEASIGHVNEHIYLAQYYDLFVLNVARLDSYLADERLFLPDYEKRCLFGSGIFNGQICYWGGRLASGNGEHLVSLKTFGEEFGTALQIANDIGDYVPAGVDDIISREYQDQQSDIRNGRLTFMLYQLLTSTDAHTRSYANLCLARWNSDNSLLHEVTRLCLREGAFKQACSLARAFINKANMALKPFGEGAKRQMLGTMASIAASNKYFVALRHLADKELVPVPVVEEANQ